MNAQGGVPSIITSNQTFENCAQFHQKSYFLDHYRFESIKRQSNALRNWRRGRVKRHDLAVKGGL